MSIASDSIPCLLLIDILLSMIHWHQATPHETSQLLPRQWSDFDLHLGRIPAGRIAPIQAHPPPVPRRSDCASNTTDGTRSRKWDETYQEQPLDVGGLVLRRHRATTKLHPRWDGPFVIRDMTDKNVDQYKISNVQGLFSALLQKLNLLVGWVSRDTFLYPFVRKYGDTPVDELGWARYVNNASGSVARRRLSVGRRDIPQHLDDHLLGALRDGVRDGLVRAEVHRGKDVLISELRAEE
ncbi:hypothetical protein EDB92DRAFT_1813481 [Lactarius akahatsu]|uniref:Uncharacterized protein n=1 Tax=Lactarius akahatsu TaxID=416441 RepID=A0AAD4LTQ2_9AGAM|nr:hypothetical protein EDB92DRAFT_1813481 [Lactarius akahatsu]